MKIYHYSRETGEFLQEGNSVTDVHSGREEYPAFCAVQPPPTTGSNETAVYRRPDGVAPKNPSNGGWSVLDDYRGHTIWKKSNAQELKVDVFGSIPATYTLLDPTGVEYPSWDGDQWGVDTVKRDAAVAKAARKSSVQAAQGASGVRGLTVEQAEAYVEERFDFTDLDATLPALRNATDLASAKAAIVDSLIEMKKVLAKAKTLNLKMVPYLLE